MTKNKKRVFTANVVTRDPATGQNVVFSIGDEVPEGVIVGDHAASLAGVTRAAEDADDVNTNDDTTVENEDGTETTIVTPDYEADADEAEADEEDDELPPYEEWSKTDLKAEAAGRELTGLSKATVEELVAALKADDAENPEE
jgi:hypothetical protein